MKNRVFVFSFLALFHVGKYATAQENTIDKIVAKVGSTILLQSDVESQYQQYIAQGFPATEATKCKLLEELLFQKLLINQAGLDSVTVQDSQVESELDRRMRYFISQIGSEQKLEEYYKKSIVEIKAEFKGLIKDQLLAQTMQSKITDNIKATPSDVRNYYEKIPKDSLPLLNSELEIGQIVKMPPISADEKKQVKEKLEKLRERIVNGEDFSTLAILYSEDPVSAKDGGALGFLNRADLVPGFSAVAFGLKGKEISPVIETEFGFHIIQLIERRGEQVNVRHILMIPQVSSSDLYKGQIFLDSLGAVIQKDSISFADAALKFSDDAESKNNGGLMVNPQTNTTRFEANEIDPTLFFVVDKMKVGEVSKPVAMQTPEGKKAYRLIYLKTRTEPHRANLTDDYQKIQAATLAQMQGKVVDDWIKKKMKDIFIQLSDDYKTCKFDHPWYTN